MYSVQIEIPLDILQAINEQISATPRLMQVAYDRATQRLRSRLLQELQTEPGPVVYADNGHLRWKSEKQRRYVMALLRSTGNLPYQRTHELSKAWHVDPIELDGGGGFSVYNTSSIIQYVEGDSAQPFHLDTGWVQAAEVITRYIDEAEEVLVQTWYTVSDINAGVS